MPTTTNRQGIRLPVSGDNPDVVDDLSNAVADIELRLAGTYTSAADRGTRNPAPAQGQIAILKDVNALTMYSGSTWVQIYPSNTPSITSGTSIPANSVGSNGDVFLKV